MYILSSKGKRKMNWINFFRAMVNQYYLLILLIIIGVFIFAVLLIFKLVSGNWIGKKSER